MQQTCRGSCHCGKVKFELDADLTGGFKIHVFDGEHWEEAAAAFRARARG